MNFYKNMISKLTDLFQKDDDSNIAKLFNVVSRQLEDMKQTLETMEEWRDIDQAQGVQLDKLGGEIVQEFRNGQTDEQYRLRIKTKIIANISKGDVETINDVLTTFLGDKFIGVSEMWSLDDPIIPPEPAGILITTRVQNPFPAGVIGRVTAGGVTIYWHIIMDAVNIPITTAPNTGESALFVHAGQLYAGPVYDRNTRGSIHNKNIVAHAKDATGEHKYPTLPAHSGTITNSTLGSSQESLNMRVDHDEGRATYKYPGSKPYQFSGDFRAGEEG
ncbi:hypothetical protein AAV35_14225 [Salimicrobium jeotgali]|uniref:Uncharacterized protein n=1 Tax=Salimicrobium jeotgali TaxID=1230341 RepID=K2GJ56_9BACI|nr:hypothetical protein [Salimicrobium jeotgali]APC65613.1 hypothetical protein AAV35_14225 [Salimicrobium jeotgali]EKE30499.1 hypothetical protein MJ3_13699 [Salimicrobium jeotgali]MBM7696648.1 hypothetical protein [Salimicrobium jeotgali]